MSFHLHSVTEQAIPGGWSEREILLGEQSVHIVLPARPDELLEQLEEATNSTQESDPYWAELWSASLPMAKLVYEASWPSDARAIELGCGIGVVGIAGLLAGLDVTLTDRVELAVATAAENARRNGLADVKAFELDWADPPQQKFSYILASDVLYDRELHVPFLQAVITLLEEGGECWIGDPGRSAASTFLALDALKSFDVNLVDTDQRAASAIKTGEFRLLQLKRLD
ncbi:MAG: methyltransferase domain-containing protein [Planctomycetes bacterium]|nr:methyltransferase domain-containing protein [Planctomycetota bacterium]